MSCFRPVEPSLRPALFVVVCGHISAVHLCQVTSFKASVASVLSVATYQSFVLNVCMGQALDKQHTQLLHFVKRAYRYLILTVSHDHALMNRVIFVTVLFQFVLSWLQL